MNTAEAFWLVWNPEGRAPTVRHPSFDSAEKEAERLARQVPDETFYILRAVEARQLTLMVCTQLVAPEDDVPF